MGQKDPAFLKRNCHYCKFCKSVHTLGGATSHRNPFCHGKRKAPRRAHSPCQGHQEVGLALAQAAIAGAAPRPPEGPWGLVTDPKCAHRAAVRSPQKHPDLNEAEQLGFPPQVDQDTGKAKGRATESEFHHCSQTGLGVDPSALQWRPGSAALTDSDPGA